MEWNLDVQLKPAASDQLRHRVCRQPEPPTAPKPRGRPGLRPAADCGARALSLAISNSCRSGADGTSTPTSASLPTRRSASPPSKAGSRSRSRRAIRCRSPTCKRSTLTGPGAEPRSAARPRTAWTGTSTGRSSRSPRRSRSAIDRPFTTARAPGAEQHGFLGLQAVRLHQANAARVPRGSLQRAEPGQLRRAGHGRDGRNLRGHHHAGQHAPAAPVRA